MTTTTEQRGCSCGCGLPVSGRATYRPGHDARHAGQVARVVTETGNYALLSQTLPSMALQRKAAAMVARAEAKQAARDAKATTAKAETKSIQPIKVGRWTYPARRVNGALERNTKRDGSGEWIAV